MFINKHPFPCILKFPFHITSFVAILCSFTVDISDLNIGFFFFFNQRGAGRFTKEEDWL